MNKNEGGGCRTSKPTPNLTPSGLEVPKTSESTKAPGDKKFDRKPPVILSQLKEILNKSRHNLGYNGDDPTNESTQQFTA